MASDGAKLVLAASQGNDAKVRRLLKAKADVHYGVTADDGRTGVRALHAATVKEINAAFGERAGELKKPAKRVGLIDMGLIHLFMM